MGMIDFWPEKNSNDFLSVKGSRHFPRGPFLSEQSYLYAHIYMNKNSTIEEERYRRGLVKKLLPTLTVDIV